jgi:hypothetical protein
VSKKIWAIHQCVDRLPETLPAAKELLEFGLELTNDRILYGKFYIGSIERLPRSHSLLINIDGKCVSCGVRDKIKE